MIKIIFAIGILFIFSFAPIIIYACDSCPSKLNFEETVEKSDLIIIGQRTDYFKREKLPEFINVKIIEVLKGDINQNQITVKSWSGMCDYGIVVDNKKYVIFLQEKDDIYDAVDFGCAEKTFLVDNNSVYFNGDKISVNEFVAKLGPQATRQILNDGDRKQHLAFYY